VYYNEKDNNGIACQKVNYFLENVRNRFNIATQTLDGDFAEQLNRKSGVTMEEISALVRLLRSAQTEPEISDEMLLELDRIIGNFYKQAL
jgi:hypothetical protein